MSQSYRLKLSRPALKMRVAARIPAQLVGGDGITITKTNGIYTISVSFSEFDDIFQPLDDDLTALAANSTNGFWARTGAGTGSARTITGTANEIAVTNGDGVSGAPTLSLPAAITLTSKTVTGGTYTGVVSINGNIWTAGTGTLTLGAGKTATISNTLTFTGTDGSTAAFGAGGTVAYTGATLAQFAATTSAQLAGVISDETGSGALVFATSPTLAGTPLAPTAAVDTNTTQIATTAMVLAQAAAASPLGNAAAAVVGTSTRFARADHVHPGREVITAARTYYVRTDGSDSNTGLVDSAGGAFLTIQKAIDTVGGIDMGIYQVTIQVKNGTFTGANSLKNWVGSLPPIILGDTTTPSNVIINPTSADAFLNDGAMPWHVRGFQLDSTTSGSQLRVKAGGVIYFQSCDFAASAGNHIFADGGGSSVIATGNYSISGAPGGDGIHILISDGASGNTEGRTVTVTGTPAWAAAYATAARNGSYRANAMTFVGSATGPRRSVSAGGVIYTAGAGDSYFPGNSTGTGTNSATSPYGNYL